MGYIIYEIPTWSLIYSHRDMAQRDKRLQNHIDSCSTIYDTKENGQQKYYPCNHILKESGQKVREMYENPYERDE